MQSFSALRQLRQVPILQHLREAVKQGPGIAIHELLVIWLSPLTKHTRDIAVGTHADID